MEKKLNLSVNEKDKKILILLSMKVDDEKLFASRESNDGFCCEKCRKLFEHAEIFNPVSNNFNFWV